MPSLVRFLLPVMNCLEKNEMQKDSVSLLLSLLLPLLQEKQHVNSNMQSYHAEKSLVCFTAGFNHSAYCTAEQREEEQMSRTSRLLQYNLELPFLRVQR